MQPRMSKRSNKNELLKEHCMEILLYGIYIILFAVTIIIVLKIKALKNIEYKRPEILSDKKILIVYFSNGGNTKKVAENLNSIVDGDLKEIELIEKYSNNIFKMSKLVRTQIKDGVLPQIKNIDILNYDIIFVGSPVWNFSISLPIKAFLKHNNFENKIIIPFFTYSGGAEKSKIIKEFEDLTQVKSIKYPLFMFENGVFLVKQQIIKWLNNI